MTTLPAATEEECTRESFLEFNDFPPTPNLIVYFFNSSTDLLKLLQSRRKGLDLRVDSMKNTVNGGSASDFINEVKKMNSFR